MVVGAVAEEVVAEEVVAEEVVEEEAVEEQPPREGEPTQTQSCWGQSRSTSKGIDEMSIDSSRTSSLTWT